MAEGRQQKSTDLCRMSWFLIQMDEGQSQGGEFNGRIVHAVIHLMNIVENDGTHMYVNRKIRINWNRNIIDGSVIMGSDDRFYVEEELKKLKKRSNTIKWLLVQYRGENSSVVHTVVNENEVVWPQDFENDVLVQDGDVKRSAKILHCNDSEDIILEKMDMLNNKCFSISFREPYENIDDEETSWILVRYSKSLKHVCYTVINVNDTVWKSENQFFTTVTYFQENDVIFQAIIIRISRDRSELENQLNIIMGFCKNFKFPTDELEGNSNIFNKN